MVRKSSKKKARISSNAIINIMASFNNTIVTITDPGGNTLVWSSSGKSGFRNSRKSTPYASQCAMRNALKAAMTENGVTNACIVIKGPGFGRESALRAIIGTGCNIIAIIDKTPLAHNGCRAPKQRRL